VSITCGTGVYATICPSDEDWWRLSVTEPSTIDVTMVCDTGGGDLDVFVKDSAGTTLGTAGTSMECDEDATAALPAAGTYYIKVRGYGGSGTYALDCELSAGAGCTDTSTCPAGMVCGTGGCISDYCDDPGSGTACPAGHFCPEPGGTAAASACVDTCTSGSDCRTGYACKHFELGRGCGVAGSGETGASCDGFWDCAGERTCLTADSTGYCAEINCTTSGDCPADANCVNVGGSENICLLDCLLSDSICDPTAGSCHGTTDVDGWPQYVCSLSYHTIPDGGL